MTFNPEYVYTIAIPPPEGLSFSPNTTLSDPVTIGTSVGTASATGATSWSISDTTNFNISSGGLVTAKVSLASGIYNFSVTASNSGGSTVLSSQSISVAAGGGPEVHNTGSGGDGDLEAYWSNFVGTGFSNNTMYYWHVDGADVDDVVTSNGVGAISFTAGSFGSQVSTHCLVYSDYDRTVLVASC